ncbi:putative hscarg dehydrogenase [Lophiostoma macrostomum CBS 122681]|uniref:Putative hscarg dehydrogenase n=1 Tax=Lophiostoma macrostomum CBS 122681 TaxID=1314788 RepID=A0A6A6SW89_9PLEO|nr:putative hscarg dehydrogenase [Lophiostoma macrostomum CBS 122681]
MSTSKPIFVVLGATGQQGGSIVTHFLSLESNPYALRGVTRDPTSSKSKSLIDQGVEMVAGNFDDPDSLDAAFKGAAVIFSVTDFWQSYASPSVREAAAAAGKSLMLATRDNEAQQGRNIIDAAAKIPTLERFIMSSLPYVSKLSGGKYVNVNHFDSKGMAEEYGAETHKELWAKTSVIIVGFYAENYTSDIVTAEMLKPVLNKEKDTLVYTFSEPLLSSPFPMISVVADTGSLVHALLQVAPGKKLIGVNEWLSLRQMTELLGEVLGKKVEIVDKELEFDLGDPDIALDMGEMGAASVELGYDGSKADMSIIQPKDLGVPVKLESLKGWASKQNWETALKVV